MKLKLTNYSHEFDYKFKDAWIYDILTNLGGFVVDNYDLNCIKIYKR